MRKYNSVAINAKDLVYPLFIKNGKDIREEISSMPGIYRFSPDTVVREAREIKKQGIRAVLLFGVPDKKDSDGTGAYKKDSAVVSTVRNLKREVPGLIAMTDVCLCAYTSHGHCGIVRPGQKSIAHKATLDVLSRMALSHAEAGADYVAPSAMAKAQVSVIRKALDAHGFKNTKIMGYSAKFASSFYGPFRNAAGSFPKFGDRSGYQLDYKDAEKALTEIADDIKEGADIVMVKPALAYLDIIYRARERFRTKLAAYNVSGEYAFVKNGAKFGLWNEKKIVFEIITSIRRAGADLIITYHAKDIARWLKER
ncbi:porphobilinogen synthase [bacterium]|jgi:porphobilinogen synthase|nr:porphobilinogen synthase [bacterium]